MEFITPGKVRLNCSHCDKLFVTFLSVAVRRPDPTCSLSCARARWPNKSRQRVTVSCEVCRKPFEVTQGRADGAKRSRARFCSNACKNKKQRGEGHPRYIDGRAKARAECRKVIEQCIRDKERCEECGATGYLHGHHIKPFATHPQLRNEPSNIQVLCNACHAAKHPDQARKLFKGVPRRGSTLTCPICSTLFYVRLSHLGSRRTCSRGCGFALRSLRARGLAPAQ